MKYIILLKDGSLDWPSLEKKLINQGAKNINYLSEIGMVNADFEWAPIDLHKIPEIETYEMEKFSSIQ